MINEVKDYIKSFKEKHSYEPSKLTIHKELDIPRVKLDKIFKEMIDEGFVEKLKPRRASQYRLK